MKKQAYVLGDFSSEDHVTWKRRQRFNETYDQISNLVDGLMSQGVDKKVASAKAVTSDGTIIV